MRYIKIFLIVILSVIINYVCLSTIISYENRLLVKSISVVSNDDDGVHIKISVDTKSDNFSCILYSNDSEDKVNGMNNECNFVIKTNTDYEIQLLSSTNKSSRESINDYLGYILDFQFKNNKIYLVPDEEYDLSYNNVLLTSKKVDLGIKSSDSSIVKIDDNKIIGLKDGNAYIYSSMSDQKIDVIVTSLIHLPKAEGKKKDIIPCGVYNDDESNTLESILEWKVNEVGYATRAGAVAAARFLTLEFQYRIPYFYENGRVSDTGVHYADGEGRYYHKGLYLTESKFSELKYNYAGPATWGCPLTNYQSLPSYGYVPGKKMPNGLDCSGFVTWALYNGGFDPGDVGAGETPRNGQCTDLGKFTYISKDLFKTGKVRTGDLINFFGHIGMIIGIDLNNDQITVAESLPNLGGAIARTYTLDSLVSTFTHVVLMDDYYKEDGNYTAMWKDSN